MKRQSFLQTIDNSSSRCRGGSFSLDTHRQCCHRCKRRNEREDFPIQSKSAPDFTLVANSEFILAQDLANFFIKIHPAVIAYSDTLPDTYIFNFIIFPTDVTLLIIFTFYQLSILFYVTSSIFSFNNIAHF